MNREAKEIQNEIYKTIQKALKLQLEEVKILAEGLDLLIDEIEKFKS